MGIPIKTMRVPSESVLFGNIYRVNGWIFTEPMPGLEAPYVVRGVLDDGLFACRVIGRGGSPEEAIRDALALSQKYNAAPVTYVPWMAFDGDSESYDYAPHQS